MTGCKYRVKWKDGNQVRIHIQIFESRADADEQVKRIDRSYPENVAWVEPVYSAKSRGRFSRRNARRDSLDGVCVVYKK